MAPKRIPRPRSPRDVFDRESEWEELTRFAFSPGRGLRLGLVYGRRRQGKSFLLRRLAAATGGFYHQALEEEARPALDRLGAALAQHLGLPAGGLQFRDWAEATRALASIESKRGPTVVVLDEFPYLLAHSPTLPSALQRTLDESRSASGAPVRLILCGSALSVMSRIIQGSQALRGRVSLELIVQPFDYRRAATFWGMRDPALAFPLHAVLGGTPGYRDLVTTVPPQSAGGLSRWFTSEVLNPASALFREDDYLLGEERAIGDRAIYHSVLGAIAAGATAEGKIGAALGRDQRAIQHALRTLERTGFVAREEDVLRRRRPLYRLTDPIIRFHHAITRIDLTRFEERRTREAWSDAAGRYTSRVLGPHFEDLAREFMRRHASSRTLGGRPSLIGPAVLNDPGGRAQHQIDVVALGSRSARSKRQPAIYLLGEAKFSTRPRPSADLRRLERIRDLLAEQGYDVSKTRLALFGASGFGRDLVAAAARGTCELIDLDRLYSGE